MRKLFSLYKKRVGPKDKTDNIEDAVDSDSIKDDKMGEVDRGSVNEQSFGAQDSGSTTVTVIENEEGSLSPNPTLKAVSNKSAVDVDSHGDSFSRKRDLGINEKPEVASALEERLIEAEGDDDIDGDNEEEEWRAGGERSLTEEPEERSRRSAPQRRRAFANGIEVLEYIPERIHSVPPRLHENLLGVVAVEVTDNNPANIRYRRYIDWRGEKIVYSELYEGIPDTTVTVSEHVLMEISRGNLNPQIALVSNRVRVTGKVGFGIYFFNLISPR